MVKYKTRLSAKSSSLIDLIITNLDHCSEVGTVDLHISDHQPVYIIKKKAREAKANTSFRGRSYLGYSKELLSDKLTNAVKGAFMRETDPNECWDLMENFLVGFLDEYCPVKTFRVRDNSPVWLSHDIITLSKDCDVAWANAKITISEHDWELAQRLRNWANNAVKTAKADFINQELENNKSDPKIFWRNIRDVLPNPKTGTIDIKNSVNGESLGKDMQAQVINDFFAGIGQSLANKFTQPIVESRDGGFVGEKHVQMI